jgi:2',3'-cyclic-nucleotide 2'-phosphodiesterase (5'-nucleotidase family)
MLLPFDNTEGKATDRSLANLASLVESEGSENILLLDNGDIIQGDSLAYYYNFVDTNRQHVVADILTTFIAMLQQQVTMILRPVMPSMTG